MGNPLHLLRGQKAEDRALKLLMEHGLTLITRNHRSRGGELDLVMQDNEQLIIVEVRYRKSTAFGHAAETVNLSKQRRIIAATQAFLLKHPKHANQAIRFDVVALHADDEPEWIKDAFQAY